MKNNFEMNDAYVVRSQSPGAEELMREKIHDALKALLEGSYLYQNKTIDLREIKAMADAATSAASLEDEFKHRPWIPFSQNRGYTSSEKNILNMSGGCDPLGTPNRQRCLTFLIPTINTWCAICTTRELHDSIPHIECSPYHLNPEAIQEPLGFRLFLFNFQCQKCKSSPLTFMVRRELDKLQLCGRSRPYFPLVPTEIPKALRRIYMDSVASAACGDWAAAFYHLRTLMEHGMKQVCEIADGQIDGTELCDRYNKRVDPVVAQRAALTGTFEICCKNLHNRKGGQPEFEQALKTIEAHFGLVENLKALQ